MVRKKEFTKYTRFTQRARTLRLSKHVGKTTMGLRERLRCHRKNSKNSNSKVNRFIREFGVGNMEMELIERCVGYKEAARLEGFWANFLGAGLNTTNPGSYIVTGKRVYDRKWEEENREHRNERKRVRRVVDGDRIRKKERFYYVENRERINALRRYNYALKNGKQPRPEDTPLPPPNAEGL